ncbi:hypothetical protein FO521_19585 [Bacillus pseudomycoides]|uniref:Uncharacterized protein n=1 Tax=Bacillus pseudomycoides TaxID=64104 RepID=A0AAJ1Z139_9BACI|nr:hypothetical protein [Bacillus pseudomycoides]MDR4326418.1 hypothetical protein [Bacillus pseudomycoides]
MLPFKIYSLLHASLFSHLFYHSCNKHLIFLKIQNKTHEQNEQNNDYAFNNVIFLIIYHTYSILYDK